MIIDGKNVLILHLKKKWFEMIKSEEKPEEYRRMTLFWTKRLVEIVPYKVEAKDEYGNIIAHKTTTKIVLKKFDEVWLLCGYPKLTDTDKIIKWNSPTLDCRAGNPQWGAPLNEFVYVIKGQRYE